jgi:hypothetical protein
VIIVYGIVIVVVKKSSGSDSGSKEVQCSHSDRGA